MNYFDKIRENVRKKRKKKSFKAFSKTKRVSSGYKGRKRAADRAAFDSLTR